MAAILLATTARRKDVSRTAAPLFVSSFHRFTSQESLDPTPAGDLSAGVFCSPWPEGRSATIARVMALTAKQRQYLRGLAHSLHPLVRIGKGGVGEPLIAETRRSLEAHELIKVR